MSKRASDRGRGKPRPSQSRRIRTKAEFFAAVARRPPRDAAAKAQAAARLDEFDARMASSTARLDEIGAASVRLDEFLAERKREIDRLVAKSELRALRFEWLHSGKTARLFAWDAWRESRRFGLPLPDWAADVLDGWEAGISRVTAKHNKPKAEELLRALGLRFTRGNSAALTKYQNQRRDLSLAVAVSLRLDDARCSEREACRAVGVERGVSYSTVDRAYRARKKDLKRPV